ncbi:MAG: sulfurase [Pseudomonadota bacterium]
MLKPTEIYGEAVFIGGSASDVSSRSAEQALLTFAGVEGDRHCGLTRSACVRFKHQYPKGAPMKNTRQLSIVSEEEMAEVGAAMGLGEPVRPEWIGANLMLRGVPDLTLLPPGARLIFPSGASVTVDLENAPCALAARSIEAARPGLGMSFPKHARGKRGVVGWVEAEGAVALGERCRLHLPPQRIYRAA